MCHTLSFSKPDRDAALTQFNALRDLAAKPGSNYCSSNWHGPAIDYWTADGVVASTPVLAMALVSKA
jgi:hypothetical protein